MRLIIEHSHTKREIIGPFNICGSREDLLSLAAQLQCSFSGDRKGVTYGWIKILPRDARQESIADTPPVSWDR